MTEKRQLTKAQILQELARLPDEILVEVWEYARSLPEYRSDSLSTSLFEVKSELDRPSQKVFSRYSCSETIIVSSVRESSTLDSTQSSDENSEIDRQAWQAYLDSERERKEVYRRLANS